MLKYILCTTYYVRFFMYVRRYGKSFLKYNIVNAMAPRTKNFIPFRFHCTMYVRARTYIRYFKTELHSKNSLRNTLKRMLTKHETDIFRTHRCVDRQTERTKKMIPYLITHLHQHGFICPACSKEM